MFDKISSSFLLVAVVVCVFIYANLVEAQHVGNGLVSYWTFDEADIDGATVKDAAGNYDGTIRGNPKVVEGKLREALLFNEETGQGDYVDLGVDINSRIVGNLTVEGWFKFTEIKPVWLHVLICAREGKSGFSYLYQSNRNDQGFKLNFRLHHQGVCMLEYRPFEPVAGEWYHFVGTYDGSNINFYSNGKNVAKLPCAEGAEKPPTTSLKIAHSTLFGGVYDLIGAVDEIRIYDRALSEVEVRKNFVASGGIAVEYSTLELSLTWGAIKVKY